MGTVLSTPAVSTNDEEAPAETTSSQNHPQPIRGAGDSLQDNQSPSLGAAGASDGESADSGVEEDKVVCDCSNRSATNQNVRLIPQDATIYLVDENGKARHASVKVVTSSEKSNCPRDLMNDHEQNSQVSSKLDFLKKLHFFFKFTKFLSRFSKEFLIPPQEATPLTMTPMECPEEAVTMEAMVSGVQVPGGMGREGQVQAAAAVEEAQMIGSLSSRWMKKKEKTTRPLLESPILSEDDGSPQDEEVVFINPPPSPHPCPPVAVVTPQPQNVERPPLQPQPPLCSITPYSLSIPITTDLVGRLATYNKIALVNFVATTFLIALLLIKWSTM